MRIAVMGTGGIGGYFGGYLAQENDVTFIARDDHLAAIRKNGLRVVSTETDLHIDPAVATDDPGTLETLSELGFEGPSDMCRVIGGWQYAATARRSRQKRASV